MAKANEQKFLDGDSRIRVMKRTGSGVLRVTLDNAQFELVNLSVHLSGSDSAAEILTVRKRKAGSTEKLISAYDFDSGADLNFSWPEHEEIFADDEMVRIDWANGDTLTWDLELQFRCK